MIHRVPSASRKERNISERTLHVHIGHPKTGTSYIQSLLATNKSQLESHGIRYPDTAFTLRARSEDPGRGGNCRATLLADASYHALVTEGSDTVVLSAERLFFPLSDGADLFASYAPHFDTVNIVLFIRDPLEFVTSWYTQRVKRGDFTGSLDDFVMASGFFTSHMDRIEGILDLCARAGYRLTVRNYSRLAVPLDDVIEGVLGLSRGTLIRPPSRKVNRGLTRSELYLQQRLHHHLGREFNLFLGTKRVTSRGIAYEIVAKALCTGLPELDAEYAALSAPVHEEFCRRIDAGIAKVNARLPESERYCLLSGSMASTAGARGPNDSLLFSEAQVDVLARSIAGVLRECSSRGGLWTRLKRWLS